MLRNLMRPKHKGNMLVIDLSKYGYPCYTVECTYHFDKKENKYSLSMWLNRNDIGDRMKISSKKISTQYISGTRETIIEDICRVVYYAATVADKDTKKKYFDKYIDRYEYELACFERGNELFEKEALEKTNDGKD